MVGTTCCDATQASNGPTSASTMRSASAAACWRWPRLADTTFSRSSMSKA
jgi:hypothetical protein